MVLLWNNSDYRLIRYSLNNANDCLHLGLLEKKKKLIKKKDKP